ncbi:hypothetical protein HK099_003725 [Clydaea vesicula]|uniref:Hexosyltransferase n=1 Tax=Clydaea vesicula TaxID=447962 RepID=A0AAD5U1A1_9FUNG|nr:hypothetical protein HK099_003725 [Clydaea vesicula]KAJ3384573.1 hypothetical protein HDU92_003505 [Lobulomyces angularis]
MLQNNSPHLNSPVKKKSPRAKLNLNTCSLKFSKIDYFLFGCLSVLSLLALILSFLKSKTPDPDAFSKFGQFAINQNTFQNTIPHSSLNNKSLPALIATSYSPKQTSSKCFGTLTVGDKFVLGTLVLFNSLKKVNSDGDFCVMFYNLSVNSVQLLNKFGVRTFLVSPLIVELYRDSNREITKSMEFRDNILWSKLRIWQLEEYDKIVMLDTDLFVVKNVDELFNYSEFAATPMIDKKEKISFWRSPLMGMAVRNKNFRPVNLPHWTGLNSGVTVLIPSNLTFSTLVNELSILPNRPCCPSQEFLLYFFEERKKYVRLPLLYNARMLETIEDDLEKRSFLRNMKIYHFVGSKPWKKRDNNCKLNRMWWKQADEVLKYFSDLYIASNDNNLNLNYLRSLLKKGSQTGKTNNVS